MSRESSVISRYPFSSDPGIFSLDTANVVSLRLGSLAFSMLPVGHFGFSYSLDEVVD